MCEAVALAGAVTRRLVVLYLVNWLFT